MFNATAPGQSPPQLAPMAAQAQGTGKTADLNSHLTNSYATDRQPRVDPGGVEMFEVYSHPITTLYSQVSHGR